jgi:hypothetical protein
MVREQASFEPLKRWRPSPTRRGQTIGRARTRPSWHTVTTGITSSCMRGITTTAKMSSSSTRPRTRRQRRKRPRNNIPDLDCRMAPVKRGHLCPGATPRRPCSPAPAAPSFGATDGGPGLLRRCFFTGGGGGQAGEYPGSDDRLQSSGGATRSARAAGRAAFLEDIGRPAPTPLFPSQNERGRLDDGPCSAGPQPVLIRSIHQTIAWHGCGCAPLVISLPPRPAAPGNHSKSHLWSSGIFLILRLLACWHRAVSHHGSMRTWIDPGGRAGGTIQGNGPPAAAKRHSLRPGSLAPRTTTIGFEHGHHRA